MLRRKFAAIKLWPGQKAAEDEVIERLMIAARSLDLECLVVDSFARLINPPHTQLTQEDVDFVLSLHFQTPKRFDIFSFVTLWNPLQFYHEFGYRKFTRHLLTHDDFLSCDSASGDDHVVRFISPDSERQRPLFRFYPSLSGPILEPTLGDKKLFYVGMNWERSIKKPERHTALLSLLDQCGDLQIYGPKVYGGVEVWPGFRSYAGPIPFDGVSVVRLINRAGLSLVLSSKAHTESEMMSSRIFESTAAGAVVICDENAFARRHFGDSLLYIDTTLPSEEAFEQIQSHLNWIKAEPVKALEKAKKAQAIFRESLRLDTCLERIYEGLSARKARLECGYTPREGEEKICVILMMPEFHSEILEQHIASCRAQKNVNVRGIVAMDTRDAALFGRRVAARLCDSPIPLEVASVQFFERRPDGSLKRRIHAGRVLSEIVRGLVNEDYVCIVAPSERLFSDHLSALLRVLQDSQEAGCAWSDMLQTPELQDKDRADLCDDPDASNASIGFGRFLFRMSALEEHIHTALPYLDTLAMRLMFGTSKPVPSRRCTVMAVGPDPSNSQESLLPLDLEREILVDFAPDSFHFSLPKPSPEAPPVQPTEPANQLQQPATISLAAMTQEERTQFAVELAHSVPMPALLKKLAFGVYRLWFRVAAVGTDRRT